MVDHRQHNDQTADAARAAGPVNPWDHEAEHFDDATDHGLNDPAARVAWRDALMEHPPEPPARIVDLGCGTGSLAVLLAHEGFHVHGIDTSRAMLDRAHTKAAGAGVTITLTQANAAEPPLQAASVDVVLCRHVLWALPNPTACLRRWINLLTPDGRLILIEGRWDTGAGIAADRCAELLTKAGRKPTIQHLTDPTLWGQTITDERYLAHA